MQSSPLQLGLWQSPGHLLLHPGHHTDNLNIATCKYSYGLLMTGPLSTLSGICFHTAVVEATAGAAPGGYHTASHCSERQNPEAASSLRKQQLCLQTVNLPVWCRSGLVKNMTQLPAGFLVLPCGSLTQMGIASSLQLPLKKAAPRFLLPKLTQGETWERIWGGQVCLHRAL